MELSRPSVVHPRLLSSFGSIWSCRGLAAGVAAEVPSSEDGHLGRWDIFPHVPSVKADGPFALPLHPVSGSCEAQVMHRDADLLSIY